jgi:putative membrane protein
MKPSHSASALVLAALIASATPALAAAPTTSANFLQEVVSTDRSETQIGRLAVLKSSSTGVQKLGEMLVDDHTAASKDAARVADTLQVALPDGTTNDQEDVYRALSSLSGSAFDAAFVNAVISSHQKAIAAFEQQATSSDPEVAAFAQQNLPKLQSHLRMAQMLKMRATEHNTP